MLRYIPTDLRSHMLEKGQLSSVFHSRYVKFQLKNQIFQSVQKIKVRICLLFCWIIVFICYFDKYINLMT